LDHPVHGDDNGRGQMPSTVDGDRRL